mmetsp:Transcript_52892/g.97864  ORF Transcript_52892/g.97864 Transcript_52892/m.97864 type:complete len:130 (-) Transcript_52892:134-523(-)
MRSAWSNNTKGCKDKVDKAAQSTIKVDKAVQSAIKMDKVGTYSMLLLPATMEAAKHTVPFRAILTSMEEANPADMSKLMLTSMEVVPDTLTNMEVEQVILASMVAALDIRTSMVHALGCKAVEVSGCGT